MSLVRSRESVSTITISMSRPRNAARTSARTAPIEASSFIVGMMTETSGTGAPCWVARISVSRSRGQRLPEQFVADVSEERGAEPQQGPERGLLPQHPSGAVPAPEGAVLQRELLPTGSVPYCLPKKVVHGIAGPMVHDGTRAERNRMARPHRADVQVDVLRGHKPFVEAADFVEHSFAVGEVRRWIRNVGAFDNQLDAFEFFERSVADLNGTTRDDVVSMEALHQLLQPKRIRNRVAVDERDGLALRLADSEVSTRAPRPSGNVQMDEVVPLLVLLHHVPGRILAVRIDDDHLEVGLLDHETV